MHICRIRMYIYIDVCLDDGSHGTLRFLHFSTLCAFARHLSTYIPFYAILKMYVQQTLDGDGQSIYGIMSFNQLKWHTHI